jgi:GT2 family glycosyltransferase
MLVVAAITNWNGAEVLEDCVRSLLEQELPNEVDIRVLVVDNGSVDGSDRRAAAMDERVALIRNDKNEGVPFAFNQCLDYAVAVDSDYLLITNNDTIVESHGIANALREIEKLGDKVVIGPTLLEMRSKDLVQSAGSRLLRCPTRVAHVNSGRSVGELGPDTMECDYTGIFVIRTKEIGPTRFKEQYFAYWEDVDYCHRLRNEGYRIAISPGFLIWHYGSFTAGKISGFGEYYGTRNRILFTVGELEPRDIVSTMEYVLIDHGLDILRRAIAGKDDRTKITIFVRAVIDGTLGRAGKRYR